MFNNVTAAVVFEWKAVAVTQHLILLALSPTLFMFNMRLSPFQ